MTKIIYQWIEMCYHYEASHYIKDELTTEISDIIWRDTFEECRTTTWKDDLMILWFENSATWSLYENIYRFLKYDKKIIWEYDMPINFSLVSHEKDISKIKRVYAHYKGLPQCYHYLTDHWIHEHIVHADNAWAAKMISESLEPWAGALCSTAAGKLYWLNILDEEIQDQKWNTTRFIVIADKDSDITYWRKANKVSLIFEAKDSPAALYKCLWAFASEWVNLSKIESLPNVKDPFTYLFWVDIEWQIEDASIQKSLELLKPLTEEIKIIWSY